MAKPKDFKHSPFDIVNVKWERTANSTIYRIWPKPHLVGVVDTKTYRWIANNLATREYVESQAKTFERARALVLSHLIVMSKNTP